MMKAIASTLALLCLPALAAASPLRAENGAYEVQVLIDGVPSQAYPGPISGSAREWSGSSS